MVTKYIPFSWNKGLILSGLVEVLIIHHKESQKQTCGDNENEKSDWRLSWLQQHKLCIFRVIISTSRIRRLCSKTIIKTAYYYLQHVNALWKGIFLARSYYVVSNFSWYLRYKLLECGAQDETILNVHAIYMGCIREACKHIWKHWVLDRDSKKITSMSVEWQLSNSL